MHFSILFIYNYLMKFKISKEYRKLSKYMKLSIVTPTLNSINIISVNIVDSIFTSKLSITLNGL